MKLRTPKSAVFAGILTHSLIEVYRAEGENTKNEIGKNRSRRIKGVAFQSEIFTETTLTPKLCAEKSIRVLQNMFH